MIIACLKIKALTTQRPRQHLLSVFSFHFMVHMGKNNFGSIRKRTAQKQNKNLKDHGMVIIKMHLSFWKSGLQKSYATHYVWSDFDNSLGLLMLTKIAMDIALHNSTAEVMLSWSAVVSIAGCQNQIKRNWRSSACL